MVKKYKKYGLHLFPLEKHPNFSHEGAHGPFLKAYALTYNTYDFEQVNFLVSMQIYAYVK
jgi:hypothetical protein